MCTTKKVKYPKLVKTLTNGTTITAAEVMADLQSAGYTNAHMQIMEASLNMHPQYMVNGLPFPGADAAYAKQLNNELGLQLLQGFVDLDELPKHLHSVLPAQK